MPVCLAFLLLARIASAEPGYQGLDGQRHSLPTNEQEITVGLLEREMAAIRSQMYENAGDVGLPGSLDRLGGGNIVTGSLTKTIIKLRMLQTLLLERDHRLRKEPRVNDDERTHREKVLAETEAAYYKPGTKFYHSTNLGNFKVHQRYLASEIKSREASIESNEEILADQKTTERWRYEGAIKLAKEEIELLRYEMGPCNELIQSMEEIPSLLEFTNRALYNLIPEGLTRPVPVPLSPALMKAIITKFKTEPDYARRFQREMCISHAVTDPKNRKSAKPGPVQIGSAQALELFLAAGDSVPKPDRATITEARVNTHQFDKNTKHLFDRLKTEYGAAFVPPVFVDGTIPSYGTRTLPLHFSASPDCPFPAFGQPR
ncbi:MAG: hypothetical protein HYR96_11550 [Deltaproteobacteria bacterium]|nr:hypothetical protein [Deltaproteobacteria bacterium]MBI3294937.1 hypothetical protein [Deltaproteobacteria bacterium]